MRGVVGSKDGDSAQQGYWKRKREKGGASDGQRASFITRESGVGPMRAFCPIQPSRFPDTGLPSSYLLFLFITYFFNCLLLFNLQLHFLSATPFLTTYCFPNLQLPS